MADWFDEGASGAAVDVPGLFPAAVVDLVLGVVATGALLSLGLSSDGGALACTVTSDGRWRREWFRTSEALETWLLGAQTFLTSARPSAASSAPRNGSRRTRAR